jgi:Glucose / Sorbosone dehydrogenase
MMFSCAGARVARGTPGVAWALFFVTLVVIAILIAGPKAAPAGATVGDGRGGVKLAKVGRFDFPTYVDAAPGFKRLLFVVEQLGAVRVVRGNGRPRTFLDISDRVVCCAERGLFSIAFPPDYKRSRRFYVFYSNRDGNLELDEFKRRRGDETRARRSSRRTVLVIPHQAASVHNGGQLQFGPDGHLWISTGDGGSGGDSEDNARDLSSLLGKLLRIDPRPSGGRAYGIPADNPYVGVDGSDEIYSYGFRNPWRFSFDRRTGSLAIGDVGEGLVEEVDYVERSGARGANFGWPQYEGDRLYDPSRPGPDPPTFPILAYRHEDGNCTVIGGYVVRDRRLRSLRGRYLYADLCAGELRSLVPRLDGAVDDGALGPTVEIPTSFGEGYRGRIYVATRGESFGDGRVWRLAPR